MAQDDNTPFFEKVSPAEFTWPVKVPVPADGRYVHATFTGRFRYLDEDGITAWLNAQVHQGMDAAGAPLARAKTDRELAAEVLLAVEDMKDAHGQPMPSTPELVAKVLAVDRAGTAVVTTFLAVARGVAAEKN